MDDNKKNLASMIDSLRQQAQESIRTTAHVVHGDSVEVDQADTADLEEEHQED